jgi:hypothetical protein
MQQLGDKIWFTVWRHTMSQLAELGQAPGSSQVEDQVWQPVQEKVHFQVQQHIQERVWEVADARAEW